MPSRSDLSKVLDALPDSAWTPFEASDDYVRSYAMIDLAGNQVRVERTQYLADDLLQRANTQERNESDGRRWGDGKVVARVPLNKWFAELRDKVKEGDRDHMSWWLNREENLPFRTFKGRIT